MTVHAGHKWRDIPGHAVNASAHTGGVDPVGSLVPLPAVEAVIAEHLVPFAEEVDRRGVRRSAIDALARVGVLGAGMSGAERREVAELIAAADASTWFCWTQHFSPMTVMAEAAPTPASGRWLEGLASGSMLAGVAFAHVRRPGPPNPIARRVEGGWSITGDLDWVTSWDIADVIMLQVHDADAEQYVCVALPAGLATEPLPNGLHIGEPLQLLAMGGTHTRPMRFIDCRLPDELVCAVLDKATWHAMDENRTVDANPATFGVIRGALADLASSGFGRRNEQALDTVGVLAQEAVVLRDRAYALADLTDRHAHRAERLRVRAQALDLCARAATAAVTARSGSAMLAGTATERRIREAMFLQVQAQTASTRDAQLALAGEQARRGLGDAGRD